MAKSSKPPLTREKVLEEMGKRPWYHKIDLGDGIVTPGLLPPFPFLYKVPERLDGLRVLDVGAWDGFWTFEAIKRNAGSVLAIDDFSDNTGDDSMVRGGWDNFDLCCRQLGLEFPRVDRMEMSVYNLNARDHGEFDVVFFFGTLYHLRHPLLAIEKIASVMRPGGRLFVESAMCDYYSPFVDNRECKNLYEGRSVVEFYPGREYGNNMSNWFVPNAPALAGMLESSGFEQIEVWQNQTPGTIAGARGWAKATRSK